MSTISLEDLMKSAGFSASDIQQVRDGKLVNSTLTPLTDRELAAKFAMKLKLPMEKWRDEFVIKPLKKEFDPSVEDLVVIKSDADIEKVKLDHNTDTMVQSYANAAPGSDLNLSHDEIKGFHALEHGATREKVEAQLHKTLLDRLNAYKAKGLSGIAPYTRKGGKEYYPGKELREKTEDSKLLKKLFPDFHRYIVDYPNHKPDGIEECFFWVNNIIDDKPTIALVHHIVLDKGDMLVFVERHFYVSRSHNSVQGIGAAYPVEGDDDTVAVYGQRTSTDQVSGIGGSAKRAMGSRVMGGKVAQNFTRLQSVVASGKV